MNFLGNILCQFYAWAKVIFLKVRQLTVNYNLKLLKPYLLQIAPSMTALCKGNFVYWHIFSKWDYRNTFSYGRWDWRAGSLGRLIRQTWHVWAFLYRDRRIFVSVRNSHGDHKQEGWESKRREKRSHSSYLRRDWEPKTILFRLFSRLPVYCSHLVGWFTLASQLPRLRDFPSLTPPEMDQGAESGAEGWWLILEVEVLHFEGGEAWAVSSVLLSRKSEWKLNISHFLEN